MDIDNRGLVVWLTGLSGAGKTTIVKSVYKLLHSRGVSAQILDGDEVRKQLCSDLDYSFRGRVENVRRVTYIANLLAENGIIVLVSMISPFRVMREAARLKIPSFLEVFVDASLEVCEQRDPKGLYKKARAGLIVGFTGIDAPYEPPVDPDVTCFTDEESVEESTEKVIAAINLKLNPIVFETPVDQNETGRRRTIAVDFDGVIADYGGWRGREQMGNPRSDVLEAMQRLREEGWKIIIHTTRCESDLLGFLGEHSIPYDEVNANCDYQNLGAKPVASVYWDDRAVKYSGNAMRDLILIRNFRTWSGRS